MQDPEAQDPQAQDPQAHDPQARAGDVQDPGVQDPYGIARDAVMPPWVRRAIIFWWTILVVLWFILLVTVVLHDGRAYFASPRTTRRGCHGLFELGTYAYTECARTRAAMEQAAALTA